MTTLPSSNFHSNDSNQSSPYTSEISLTTNTSSSSGPPIPPPHLENVQFYTPAPTIRQNQMANKDFDYLPSSSIDMATEASKRRSERIDSVNREFPPASVENIRKLRDESEQSKDPSRRLFFARYLLHAASHLAPNPEYPERTEQLKNNLQGEAMKIIKKLASYKTGYAEAQLFLGNCYGNGDHGLKQDVDKAFALYLQGSKQNHPECTYRVAVCYEHGLGTKRNYRHAMQFYKKAANLSDPSGMYKLGLILLDGLIGQQKNPREAISWFLRAAQIADENHPEALHQLGLIHEKESDIPSVIPDVDYARELFSQAAVLGYAPSQYKLGWAYENACLNCPTDPRRSIAWYSCAAEQNDGEAELALSGWCFTGAEGILPQNDTEAYLWAKKAAEKELPKAEYAMGYYTEMGIGVPKDLDKAKRWYTKAANHGDEKAIQRLKVLERSESTPLKRRPTRNKNGKPTAKSSDCVLM
ncbi:hypothetical protein CU097_002131 [Rhizopus azygosporus]|uniref:HCP-like protein n=2 Tax=Rhizopus TaxID=4842 RepID=A0A367IZI3_RHIAZ|nr:hypothetical protein CU097_002131 [Rhizopus azygosporus]CEI92148.1 hypothetical protein RMCBS344292_06418 [Rhizopus microsporus]